MTAQGNDYKVSTERKEGDRGGQHTGCEPQLVKVLHIPTGIYAVCGTERSQLKNREIAIAMVECGLEKINDKQ